MGAAIESFAGAAAIAVERDRFAPVKTTGDLLIIRSDACRLTDDFRLELAPERAGVPPVVNLDTSTYKLVDGLEKMVARAVPGLLHCRRLTVKGPVVFAPGVIVQGDASFENPGLEPKEIAAGIYGA